MYYRVGLPGWKLAARSGVTVKFVVRVYEDEETKSFWAESDDLDGLVVSGGTLPELRAEVRAAAEALLDLALNGHHPRTVADLRLPEMSLAAA